jgi:aspartate aminotransferase
VWLMSDEIYEHFVYDGVNHVSPIKVLPELQERSLVVNGASKGYSMTGWRIGYGAGPTTLVNAIAKLASQTTTCPSSISQAAAVTAFGGSQDAPQEASRVFAARGKLMAELLQEANGMDVSDPKGAFYVYPSVARLIGKVTPSGQKLESDLDVATYFIEAGVATVDGTAYGLAPYLRLSFATSEIAIREGCKRIVRACAALR